MGMEEDPRASARELAARLHERWGAGLRSVLLYGSVARGEYVAGLSDVNVLVLLDEVDAARLREGAPPVREWFERTGSTPLIMAKPQWRRAADAFAIELADMHDAHEVLHGPDPLEGLAVDPAALRLQAEREVRGKLVRLDTAVLLHGDDDAALGAMLVRALPSFTTYLRVVLRLAGRPVPARTVGVLESSAGLLGVAGDALLTVAAARAGAGADGAAVDVEAYRAAVQRAADFIDSVRG
jgi:predicted nucleotidyltransferase